MLFIRTQTTALTAAILCVAIGSAPAFAGSGCQRGLIFESYFHTAIDDACLEIDAQSGKLKISNLGSSGCDGVSIAPGPLTFPVECDAEFEPVSLDEPNSSMTATMRGLLSQGPPDSMIMELHAENDGNDVVITADFSPLGSQTHTVEVYAQGTLVHSLSGSSGPAVRLVALPRAAFAKIGAIKGEMVDQVGPPPVHENWEIDFDQLADILVVGDGTTVPGDRVRIIAESPTDRAQEVSKCEYQAGGLLVPEIEMIALDISGTMVDPCQEPANEGTRVLYVNGSQGGDGGPYNVQANGGDLVWAALLLPDSGGNGKFVMHANYGSPTPVTVTSLPASIGTFCFPLLLAGGADPAAVWNNIGKEGAIGSSEYFDGTPMADPDKAPVVFLQLVGGDAVNLPPGTDVTLQGVIIDPASISPKSASSTNAVTLQIL